MQILIVSHYFYPEVGAPSARLMELGKELSRMGHSVHVFTCWPNHPVGRMYDGYKNDFYGKEVKDSIIIHRFKTYVTPNKGILRKTLGHFSFLASVLVQFYKAEINPHHVIASSPTLFAGQLGYFLSKLYKAKFTFEIRDLWPGCFKALGVIKNKFILNILECWELKLYRLADYLVVVTNNFKLDLQSRGVRGSKITVIPNGVDFNFWYKDLSIKNHPFINDSKLNVIYVGAHGISQDLSILLRIAEEVKLNSNIHFTLIGDGADKQNLIALAEKKELKNVTFHGFQNKTEIRKLYSKSNFGVVCLKRISIFDSFIPSKIFEMMACQLPIIGLLSGETADIIKDSKCGWVFTRDNSKGVAKLLLDSLTNKSKFENHGLLGRKYAYKNFNRQSQALLYHDLITTHE